MTDGGEGEDEDGEGEGDGEGEEGGDERKWKEDV